MGTILNEVQFQSFLPSTFVFDLEYVGIPNCLERCYIWEIGAIHLATGRQFSITMDPGIRPLPPPMSSEFANVTEEFLMRKRACDFNFGWSSFLQFINSFSCSKVLLIAHNNFKSDKIMLEIESKRRKLQLPSTWYFMDSLLYCRKAIPRQPSYTLHDLYMGMLGKKIEDNHSALPDAKALLELLYYTGLEKINGPIYPSFCTSLQVVKWLGPSCERALFDRGVHSLEQLIANINATYSLHILKNGQISLGIFVQSYIAQTCGIQSGNSESISLSILEKWLPAKK